MSTPDPSDPSDRAIPYLTGAEIRARFIEFFAERGHTVVPSASLVPARGPDAAVHQLRHGPVQGRAHRGGEAGLRPGRGLPACPARGGQAQRLRGGRADAPPPHPVRDAGQLELRRLLQARGHPLGVAVPHEGPPDPRRTPRGHGLLDRRRRPRRLEGRDRPAAGAPRPLGRLPGRRREELVAHGRRRARAAPARSSTTTAARTSPRAPSACRTTPSTARAGSRSGTSCSWSSSCTRTAA